MSNIRTTSSEKSRLVVDPWSLSEIKNYSILIEEFGIEPIETIMKRIPEPHKYMKRGIVFGHTELDKIFDAINNNSSYGVMSGIKPTGPLHLGSKMTVEEIIYFQTLSPKAFVSYCIADYEAYADNRISFKKSFKIAVDNIADVLTLGLDADKAYIYRQSSEKRVLDMAFTFARDVTYNMLESIYGDKSFGLYLSALVQAGDILLPQHKDFGGSKPVVVPIGADQAPHIRLTRDLARKYQKSRNLILPSATYHKLTKSLTGSFKMSKRDPMGILYLCDKPEVASKKILEAFTGGKDTVKLQTKLGGEPKKCSVYELYVYHFIDDDDKIVKIYNECTNGDRLCGDCKKQLAELVVKYLTKHQAQKVKYFDMAKELMKSSSLD